MQKEQISMGSWFQCGGGGGGAFFFPFCFVFLGEGGGGGWGCPSISPLCCLFSVQLLQRCLFGANYWYTGLPDPGYQDPNFLQL